MSATDELRRLLDERGVKWEDASPVPSMKQWKTSFTSFTGEEVSLGCYEEPKWIMGTMVFHTPEQAVEATLGRGTCRLVRHGNLADHDYIACWSCSECSFGWHHSIYDKQFSYCPNCGRKVVS